MIKIYDEVNKEFHVVIKDYSFKITSIKDSVYLNNNNVLLWVALEKEGITVSRILEINSQFFDLPLSLLVFDLLEKSSFQTDVLNGVNFENMEEKSLAELHSWGQWLNVFRQELIEKSDEEIATSRHNLLLVAEPMLTDVIQLKESIKVFFAYKNESYGKSLNVASASRIESGQPCPRDGWWSTPAKAGSRSYFKVGETMPVIASDYGNTIWQWDVDQSASSL